MELSRADRTLASAYTIQEGLGSTYERSLFQEAHSSEMYTDVNVLPVGKHENELSIIITHQNRLFHLVCNPPIIPLDHSPYNQK